MGDPKILREYGPAAPYKANLVLEAERPSNLQYAWSNKYDADLSSLMNQKWNRADNQSGLGQLWNGFLSRSASIIPKTISGFAFVEGAIEGIIDSNKGIEYAWENNVVKQMDKWDEALNQSFPVYQSHKYDTSGLLGKMLTTSMWATDFLDGAAYAASAYVPGGAAKAIGSVSRIALQGTKLATTLNATKLSAPLTLGISTAYNTVSEAGAEAHEAQKSLELLLSEKYPGKSKEEIKQLAAKGAKEVFYTNLALLGIPNYVQSKFFHGDFVGLTKSIKRAIIDKSDDAIKELLPSVYKNAIKGVVSEGFFEENFQVAVQQYEKALAKGTVEPDLAANMASNMLLGIKDFTKGLVGFEQNDEETERGLSVFLGAVLGSGMGSVSSLHEQKHISAIAKELGEEYNYITGQAIPNALKLFSQNNSVAFRKTKDGIKKVKIGGNEVELQDLEFDANGNPVLDPETVTNLLNRSFSNNMFWTTDFLAALSSNEKISDFNKEMALAAFAYSMATSPKKGFNIEDVNAILDATLKTNSEDFKAANLEEPLTKNINKVKEYVKRIQELTKKYPSKESNRKDHVYNNMMLRTELYLDAKEKGIGNVLSRTDLTAEDRNVAEDLMNNVLGHRDAINKNTKLRDAFDRTYETPITLLDQLKKLEDQEKSKGLTPEQKQEKTKLKYKLGEHTFVFGDYAFSNTGFFSNPIGLSSYDLINTEGNLVQRLNERRGQSFKAFRNIQETFSASQSTDAKAYAKAINDFQSVQMDVDDNYAAVRNELLKRNADLKDETQKGIDSLKADLDNLSTIANEVSDYYYMYDDPFNDPASNLTDYLSTVFGTPITNEQEYQDVLMNLTNNRNSEIDNLSNILGTLEQHIDFINQTDKRIGNQSLDKLETALKRRDFNTIDAELAQAFYNEYVGKQAENEVNLFKGLSQIEREAYDNEPLIRSLIERLNTVVAVEPTKAITDTAKTLLNYITEEIVKQLEKNGQNKIENQKIVNRNITAPAVAFLRSIETDLKDVPKIKEILVNLGTSYNANSFDAILATLYKIAEVGTAKDLLLAKLDEHENNLLSTFLAAAVKETTSPTVVSLLNRLLSNDKNYLKNPLIFTEELLRLRLGLDYDTLDLDTTDKYNTIKAFFLNKDIFTLAKDIASDPNFSSEQKQKIQEIINLYNEVQSINRIRAFYKSRLSDTTIKGLEQYFNLKEKYNLGFTLSLSQNIVLADAIIYLTSPNTKSDTAYSTSFKLFGIGGSGKTHVIGTMATSIASEFNSDPTKNGIYAVGPTPETSQNISEAVYGAPKQRTIDDLLAATPTQIKSTYLFIIDEALALLPDVLLKLDYKIRTENPNAKIIYMGDPAQRIAGANANEHDLIHAAKSMDAFTTIPLNTSFRTNIDSIGAFLSNYRTKFTVKHPPTVRSSEDITKVSSTDKVNGVVVLMPAQILDILQLPSSRTRVLIVSDLNEFNYYNNLIGNNVAVRTIAQAQGYQWDEVYAIVNPNNLGSNGGEVNRNLFTAFSRAKSLLVVGGIIDINNDFDSTLADGFSESSNVLKVNKELYNRQHEQAKKILSSFATFSEEKKEELTSDETIDPKLRALEDEYFTINKALDDKYGIESEDVMTDSLSIEDISSQLLDPAINNEGHIEQASENRDHKAILTWPTSQHLGLFFNSETNSTESPLPIGANVKLVRVFDSKRNQVVIHAFTNEHNDPRLRGRYIDLGRIGNLDATSLIANIDDALVGPSIPRSSYESRLPIPTDDATIQASTIKEVKVHAYNSMATSYGDSYTRHDDPLNAGNDLIEKTLVDIYNGLNTVNQELEHKWTITKDGKEYIDWSKFNNNDDPTGLKVELKIFSNRDIPSLPKGGRNFNIIRGVPYLVIHNARQRNADKNVAPIYVRMPLRKLDAGDTIFTSIRAFKEAVDIIEIELGFVGVTLGSAAFIELSHSFVRSNFTFAEGKIVPTSNRISVASILATLATDVRYSALRNVMLSPESESILFSALSDIATLYYSGRKARVHGFNSVSEALAFVDANTTTRNGDYFFTQQDENKSQLRLAKDSNNKPLVVPVTNRNGQTKYYLHYSIGVGNETKPLEDIVLTKGAGVVQKHFSNLARANKNINGTIIKFNRRSNNLNFSESLPLIGTGGYINWPGFWADTDVQEAVQKMRESLSLAPNDPLPITTASTKGQVIDTFRYAGIDADFIRAKIEENTNSPVTSALLDSIVGTQHFNRGRHNTLYTPMGMNYFNSLTALNITPVRALSNGNINRADYRANVASQLESNFITIRPTSLVLADDTNAIVATISEETSKPLSLSLPDLVPVFEDLSATAFLELYRSNTEDKGMRFLIDMLSRSAVIKNTSITYVNPGTVLPDGQPVPNGSAVTVYMPDGTSQIYVTVPPQYINEDSFKSIVLHELIHALTGHALWKVKNQKAKDRDKNSPEYKLFARVQQLKKQYEAGVEALGSDARKMYQDTIGEVDEREFIANLSNRDFRANAIRIKIRRGTAIIKELVNAVVDFFRSIFGVTIGSAQDIDLLRALTVTLSDYINETEISLDTIYSEATVPVTQQDKQIEDRLVETIVEQTSQIREVLNVTPPISVDPKTNLKTLEDSITTLFKLAVQNRDQNKIDIVEDMLVKKGFATFKYNEGGIASFEFSKEYKQQKGIKSNSLQTKLINYLHTTLIALNTPSSYAIYFTPENIVQSSAGSVVVTTSLPQTIAQRFNYPIGSTANNLATSVVHEVFLSPLEDKSSEILNKYREFENGNLSFGSLVEYLYFELFDRRDRKMFRDGFEVETDKEAIENLIESRRLFDEYLNVLSNLSSEQGRSMIADIVQEQVDRAPRVYKIIKRYILDKIRANELTKLEKDTETSQATLYKLPRELQEEILSEAKQFAQSNNPTLVALKANLNSALAEYISIINVTGHINQEKLNQLDTYIAYLTDQITALTSMNKANPLTSKKIISTILEDVFSDKMLNTEEDYQEYIDSLVEVESSDVLADKEILEAANISEHIKLYNKSLELSISGNIKAFLNKVAITVDINMPTSAIYYKTMFIALSLDWNTGLDSVIKQLNDKLSNDILSIADTKIIETLLNTIAQATTPDTSDIRNLGIVISRANNNEKMYHVTLGMPEVQSIIEARAKQNKDRFVSVGYRRNASTDRSATLDNSIEDKIASFATKRPDLLPRYPTNSEINALITRAEARDTIKDLMQGMVSMRQSPLYISLTNNRQGYITKFIDSKASGITYAYRDELYSRLDTMVKQMQPNTNLNRLVFVANAYLSDPTFKNYLNLSTTTVNKIALIDNFFTHFFGLSNVQISSTVSASLIDDAHANVVLFLEDVVKTNPTGTVTLNEEGEVETSFLDWKESMSGYVTTFSKILASNSEYVRNPSVRTLKGDRYYTIHESSHIFDVATSLINRKTNTRIVLPIYLTNDSSIAKHNIFLTGKNELLSHGEYEGTKDEDTQITVPYTRQTKSKFYESKFMGAFVEAARSSAGSSYYQFSYTPSDKPKAILFKTNILSYEQLYDATNELIEQITNEIERTGVQHKFIGSEFIKEAIDNLKISTIDAASLRQNKKAINDEAQKVLGRYAQKLSADLTSNVTRMNFDKRFFDSANLLTGKLHPYYRANNVYKEMASKAFSTYDPKANNGQGGYGVDATTVLPVIDLFVRNNAINGYFLNQLFVGNTQAYSNSTDVIKRYAGVAAPRVRTLVDSRIGSKPTYKLLVFKDTKLSKEDLVSTLASLLNTDNKQDIERISEFFDANFYDITDGQGFMTLGRLMDLSRGFGSSYRLGMVHKPVHFGKNKDGNAVYIKYSSVSPSSEARSDISKAILDTVLSKLEQLGIDEGVFDSAIKVNPLKVNRELYDKQGISFKEFLETDISTLKARLESTDPNSILPLPVLTLNNSDYGFQHEASTDPTKSVSPFTQLLYFINMYSETDAEAERVYGILGDLIDMSKEDFLSQIDTPSKLRNFLATKLSGRGSENALRLLLAGVSLQHPGIEKKAITALTSALERAAIKQKFKGGKLVLQSSEGIHLYYSDEATEDLNEVLKRELSYGTKDIVIDGQTKNILYAEAIVPKELLMPAQIEALESGQDLFLYGDLLGFRIPSTEIHSAVPLKVVGIYTAKKTELSNIIIAPKELVPLHGSDFDVDSLFIVSRETFTEEDLSYIAPAQISDYLSKRNQLKAALKEISSGAYSLSGDTLNINTLKTKLRTLLNEIESLKEEIDINVEASNSDSLEIAFLRSVNTVKFNKKTGEPFILSELPNYDELKERRRWGKRNGYFFKNSAWYVVSPALIKIRELKEEKQKLYEQIKASNDISAEKKEQLKQIFETETLEYETRFDNAEVGSFVGYIYDQDKGIYVYDKEQYSKLKEDLQSYQQLLSQLSAEEYEMRSLVSANIRRIKTLLQKTGKNEITETMLKIISSDNRNIRNRMITPISFKVLDDAIENLKSINPSLAVRTNLSLSDPNDEYLIYNSLSSGQILTGAFANAVKVFSYINKSSSRELERYQKTFKVIIQEIEDLEIAYDNALAEGKNEQEVNSIGVQIKDKKDALEKLRIEVKSTLDKKDRGTLINKNIAITYNNRILNRLSLTAGDYLLSEVFDTLINAAIDNLKIQKLPAARINARSGSVVTAMLFLGIPLENVIQIINIPQLRAFVDGDIDKYHLFLEDMLAKADINIEQYSTMPAEISMDTVTSLLVKPLDKQTLREAFPILKALSKMNKMGEDVRYLAGVLDIIRNQAVTIEDLDAYDINFLNRIGTIDPDTNLININSDFSFNITNLFNSSKHIKAAYEVHRTASNLVNQNFLIHSEAIREQLKESFSDNIEDDNQADKVIIETKHRRNLLRLLNSEKYSEVLSQTKPMTAVITLPNGTRLVYALSPSASFFHETALQIQSLKRFIDSYNQTNPYNKIKNDFLAHLSPIESPYGTLTLRFSSDVGLNSEDINTISAHFFELNRFNYDPNTSNWIYTPNILPYTLNALQNRLFIYSELAFDLNFSSNNFGLFMPARMHKESVDYTISRLKDLSKDMPANYAEVLKMFTLLDNAGKIKHAPKSNRATVDKKAGVIEAINTSTNEKVKIYYHKLFKEDNKRLSDYIKIGYGTNTKIYRRINLGGDLMLPQGYVAYTYLGKSTDAFLTTPSDAYRSEVEFDPRVATITSVYINTNANGDTEVYSYDNYESSQVFRVVPSYDFARLDTVYTYFSSKEETAIKNLFKYTIKASDRSSFILSKEMIYERVNASPLGRSAIPTPLTTNTTTLFTWARTSANNYEVSTRGDRRFSALNAKLKDGRTIEEAYQLDIKGYRLEGNNWKLGKGKAPLTNISREETWQQYKALWKQYFNYNPQLLEELRRLAKGKVLTDMFANTEISQARALAEILNETATQQPTAIDITNSAKKTDYFEKDKIKFSRANKLIARGSENSSSEAYRIAAGKQANVGIYIADDVVGISAEGNRKGRIAPDFNEIQKAIDAKVTFITDIASDRNRDYNVGEREVANYLSQNGYREIQDGVWVRATQQSAAQTTVDKTLSWEQLKDMPVYSDRGVMVMRKQGTNEHFGNPFTGSGITGLVQTADVSDAVVAYKDWLKDDYVLYETPSGAVAEIREGFKKEQRDWILSQIEQGNLDGKSLLYMKTKEDYYSHADVLADLVNSRKNVTPNRSYATYFSLTKEEAKNSPAIKELDDTLTEFLTKYHVDIKTFANNTNLTALGIADILNKVIHVAENRNVDTLPEEAAHMIMMLMGQNNEHVSALMANIHTWDEYQNIYAEYKEMYNNDIERVKFEASGKLLAKAIVSKFTQKEKKGFQKLIDDLIKFFRDIFYPTIEKEIPTILKQTTELVASKVLALDESLINFKPRYDYIKVIPKNVFDANPFEKDLVERITAKGGNLTGSLAIAEQSTIYRDPEELIHDLDFQVKTFRDFSNISLMLRKKGAIPIHSGFEGKTVQGEETSAVFSYLVPKPNYKIVASKRYTTGWKAGTLIRDSVIVQDITSGKYYNYNESLFATVDLMFNKVSKPTRYDVVAMEYIYQAKQQMNPGSSIFFKREKDQIDYVNMQANVGLRTISDYMYYQTAPSDIKPTRSYATYLTDDLKQESGDISRDPNGKYVYNNIALTGVTRHVENISQRGVTKFDPAKEKAERLFTVVPEGSKINTTYGELTRDEYENRLRAIYDRTAALGEIYHLLIHKHFSGDPLVNNQITNISAKHDIVEGDYNWLDDTVIQNIITTRTNTSYYAGGSDKVITELLIAAPALDMVGRVDLLIDHGSNVLSIFDIKTGRGFDREVESALLKYGDSLGTLLYDNARTKAHMQLMFYALMLRSQRPDIRFRNIKNLHIISPDDMTDSIRNNVNPAPYLEVIKLYLQNEKPNLYAKLSDEQKKTLFEASDYMAIDKSAMRNEMAFADIANELSSKIRRLESLILFDKTILNTNVNDTSNEARKARRDEIKALTEDIIKLKGQRGVNYEALSADISWMDAYLGSSSYSTHPYVQLYHKMFQEQKKKYLERYNKIRREHTSILETMLKSMGENKSSYIGGSNRKAIFEALTVEENLADNITRRRLLTKADANWSKLNKAQQNYLTFYQQVVSSFFVNDTANPYYLQNAYIDPVTTNTTALATRTVTFDKRGMPLTNLDLYNGVKDLTNAKNPFVYYEGFFPKVAPQIYDISSRHGNLSSQMFEFLRLRYTTFFEEAQFEGYLNVDEAIPMRFLDRTAVLENEYYSMNLELAFDSFVKHHIFKGEMDEVYAFANALKIYLMAKEGLEANAVFKNLISFFDKSIELHLLNRKQSEIAATRLPFGISIKTKNGIANYKQFNFVKFLRSLKTFMYGPTMWLKPITGTANFIFASLMNIKEAVRNNYVISSPNASFNVSDLMYGYRMAWQWQFDAARGKLRENKTYLLMEKMGYLPDNYDWYVQTNELLTTRNRLFSTRALTAAHTIPEEIIAASLFVAQLRAMKLEDGSSVWDHYKRVEKTTNYGEKYVEYEWDGTVRGRVRKYNLSPSLDKDLPEDQLFEDLTDLSVDEVSAIKYLYERVHGSYRGEERSIAEYYIAGELMLQLKRYFPSMLKNAFASRGMRTTEGEYQKRIVDGKEELLWTPQMVEGRYRLFVGQVLNLLALNPERGRTGDSLRRMLDKNVGINLNNSYKWESLSNAQKRDLVDLYSTFLMMLSLNAAGSVMWDEDEEDSLRKIYFRIVSDFGALSNPIELANQAIKFGTQPIAPLKWVKLFTAAGDVAFNSFMYAALGEEEYLNNKGEIKGIREFSRHLPFSAAYHDLLKFYENAPDSRWR